MVDAGDRAYHLTHPASAEALIDERDFDREERLPYRSELWPSCIALACHVSALDLSGSRIIELGRGLGLPSMVALTRGADVVAADHYRSALDFAAHNAQKNTRREPETSLFDWRAPEEEALGVFDLVLADPRRKYTPDFLNQIQERGFEFTKRSMTVEQDGREVEVLIHELKL